MRLRVAPRDMIHLRDTLPGYNLYHTTLESRLETLEHLESKS